MNKSILFLALGLVFFSCTRDQKNLTSINLQSVKEYSFNDIEVIKMI